MDWNLFWSAFGAIGSTLGSFVTAIALIIAIKQYKQPLKKRIDVDIIPVHDWSSSHPLTKLYCVSVKNKGIRTIDIRSICIEYDDIPIAIDSLQYKDKEQILLPCQLEPEKCQDFYYEAKEIMNIFARIEKEGISVKDSKFKIMARDIFGEKYVCKSKIKISELNKW